MMLEFTLHKIKESRSQVSYYGSFSRQGDVPSGAWRLHTCFFSCAFFFAFAAVLTTEDLGADIKMASQYLDLVIVLQRLLVLRSRCWLCALPRYGCGKTRDERLRKGSDEYLMMLIWRLK
jgi:hypothetical protein